MPFYMSDSVVRETALNLKKTKNPVLNTEENNRKKKIYIYMYVCMYKENKQKYIYKHIVYRCFREI